MALTKKTYVDGETKITAENLNAIQDAIVDLEKNSGGGTQLYKHSIYWNTTSISMEVITTDPTPISNSSALGALIYNSIKATALELNYGGNAPLFAIEVPDEDGGANYYVLKRMKSDGSIVNHTYVFAKDEVTPL